MNCFNPKFLRLFIAFVFFCFNHTCPATEESIKPLSLSTEFTLNTFPDIERVDPNFRQKVLNELEGIHTTFKGQHLLNIFFAEQLKRSSPADLKNILQLKQKYDELINLNSAQK